VREAHSGSRHAGDLRVDVAVEILSQIIDASGETADEEGRGAVGATARPFRGVDRP
jgi:hypothetical protein